MIKRNFFLVLVLILCMFLTTAWAKEVKETNIHNAIRKGDLETVKILLEKNRD